MAVFLAWQPRPICIVASAIQPIPSSMRSAPSRCGARTARAALGKGDHVPHERYDKVDLSQAVPVPTQVER